MALEEIRSERVRKLNILREEELDPYPASLGRVSPIRDVTRRFLALAKSKKMVRLAGRIMAKREHGGATFFDIRDASGKIQSYFRKDATLHYERAIESVDIGDFVLLEGTAFATKKGEPTLEVHHWELAAKSLRPLPEKWHGLQDVEERFRKRYLDLLMNEEVRQRFLTRSEIVRHVREFHEKEGFSEVETPMLHLIPGGTLAQPFVTHHNALDIDLYLRIAPELYLKRLLVGGLERVFEIGKSFRNEGIDAAHNPEFTMLECYAAWWDEEDMMRFVERLCATLAKKFGGKQGIVFQGKKIALKTPFPRLTFKELLARYALITDYERETQSSLLTRARQFGIEVKPRASKGGIADEIFKKICRPYLQNPTFVIHHPTEISPLAKKWQENPAEVRRFQLVIAGLELANGWAELNDPLEQRERFEAQEVLRSGGEEEAHRTDEDYLEALEYGMPPAAGLGIGVDRLVMLLTDTKNIREVVLFPTLRPKKEE